MMTAVTAVNSLGARAYNPRGNLWFNDESTYGRKLLMKMGWSKGKGLGKNEDGIKENLSVKFRNTNSGLGYADDPYASLMKTEYESILKNLSDCYSQTGACAVQKENKYEKKNCEQKSKVVGSKLRYPKLFYGKDVSKYSEKDMKSIFICSQQSKDNQGIPEDSILHQKKESESELPKEVETHSSTLSISDYFAKKMKEKKKNLLTKEAFNVPDQQQTLDSEITKKDIFSAMAGNKPKMDGINLEKNGNQESINISDLQQIETALESSKTSENVTLPITKTSKKKKKSHINKVVSNDGMIKEAFNDLGLQQLPLDPEIIKTDFLSTISNKKFKKNRINSEINLNREYINNFDLQKTEKELEVDRAAENLTLPGKNSSSKKEKKSKISEVKVDTSHASECIVSNSKKRKLSEDLSCEDNVLKICKKKRKSKIYENGNCSVDDLDVDLVAHNVNESKISCQIELCDADLRQKKKLKKRHKEREMGTDEAALPLKNSQITNEDPSLRSAENENVICLKKNKKNKVKLKKLRSCLKSKSGNYSFKNVSFNENVSYRIIDSCLDSVNCQPVAFSYVQNNLIDEIVDTVDERKTGSNDNNEAVDVVNEVKTELGVNTCISEEISSDANKSNSDVSAEIAGEVSDEELKESCSLFSLPSHKSSHYNNWVESQRQALKMDLYKRMLKSIKKHKVLKSTNLLSIKGYGNWGFE